MYSIRNRSFICRIALLIVFLEYSFIVKSSSNRDVCLKNNRRIIQYIKPQQEDATEVDWNTAWKLCSSQNLTVPVICNRKEQDAFANYLRRLIIIGSAWTSGKKITLREWTWVNGQVFKSRENITVSHESYVHGALKQDRSYGTDGQYNKVDYLCQYSGSLCNDNTYITMRNSCLNVSGDDRIWYDARNRCLENGGDLAVLDDEDRNILKNSSRLKRDHSYWIGLRKISWQWNISASIVEEVKFSNWAKETYSASGECISIDASTGDWKAVGCMDKKKVICERTLDETKSSSTPSTVPNTTLGTTLSSTLSTTQSRTSSKTLHTTPSTSLSTTLSNSFSTTLTSSTLGFTEKHVLLISVLVVGVCLIVISNVVVGVLVRRHTKAQFSSSTETHLKVGYQDLQTTQGQMNSNIDSNYDQLQLQPEYEEVGRDGRSH